MKRKILFLALALGVMAASQAMAQADIGFKRVGASLGYVNPENVDGTLGIGVFADLGTVAPAISLEPRIDFWSKSQDAFGSSASISDVTVSGRAKYNFTTSNPNLRPFAGGGLGLHFLHSEATIAIPGFASETFSASDTKLGLELGGGVATTVSPRAELTGEMWYGIVSDFNQLAIRVGVSYKLGS
jgi:opacity protein-like surface antigen